MEIKERILISSLELFINNGLKSVTMDDVSTNLGMSKRTIYENFTNKKDLIEACVDYLHTKQNEHEAILMSNSQGVIDELFRALDKIDEDFKKEGKFSYEVKKYYPEIFEERYRSYYDNANEKLKKRLQKGIKQGIILPTTNINFAVYVIMETIYNLMSRPENIILTKISVTDAFKYVIIYFFRGISTTIGIEQIDKKIDEQNLTGKNILSKL